MVQLLLLRPTTSVLMLSATYYAGKPVVESQSRAMAIPRHIQTMHPERHSHYTQLGSGASICTVPSCPWQQQRRTGDWRFN
jgi:hypothetical protein